MSALTLHRNIDFGNGGAFPEIHMPQYPLGMGRDKIIKPGTKILPVTVDANEEIEYDGLIIKQFENSKRIVYSQHKDLVPKILKDEKMDEDEKEEEELQEVTRAETKAAIEKTMNVLLSAAHPYNVPKQSSDSKYFKFTTSEKSGTFNSGAKERMIKMVGKPVDPLEPPKFKRKRVPRPSGSPPVPVMHSPPRPVSAKDQKEWTKIPPCTSNWKNPKGYTIPMDKRLVADGRGLHDVQINDNFAKLAESLYVAEEKAREEIEAMNQVKLELNKKEKEKKERELRELARKARSERAGMDADVPNETVEERQGKFERNKIREEKHGERKMKRRLEAKDGAMGKKSKTTRDRDRDISEKVALGIVNVGGAGSGGGEVMYDYRLFNHEKGMDSGFATDDQYNVYDKGLITSQHTISILYRPMKDVDAMKDVDSKMFGGADEQLDKIRKTERFKPDRGFGGTEERAAGRRDGPVEFERDVAEDADLFGLDQLITKMKKKGKKGTD